ncbi:MAG TPA: hypothetical protein VFF69_06540 [Phycisphaerales bacterium]|nr:hypothetical protein [Phycisphaerales bacterium]
MSDSSAVPHRGVHYALLSALSLALCALLAACANDAVHFPRPDLYAGRATSWPEAADVEVIAQNRTDAPLWLRRLDLTLSVGGDPLAAGLWEGDRQIDAGSGVLLGISLPMIEGASAPPADAPGSLEVTARYARSGVIGLLGGETHTYTLPIVIRRGVEQPTE